MRSELQILQECQGIDAPVALLLAFHRRAVLAYREKGRCVPMQSQSTRETLSISIRATERSSRHNGPLEKEERRVRCYDVWNDDRAILELPADRPTDRPTDATEGALIRFFPPILVRSAAADCARPSLYLARVKKSDNGQWARHSPFAEMLTHFTRTPPYRIAGFRRGREGGRRVILQEN